MQLNSIRSITQNRSDPINNAANQTVLDRMRVDCTKDTKHSIQPIIYSQKSIRYYRDNSDK